MGWRWVKSGGDRISPSMSSLTFPLVIRTWIREIGMWESEWERVEKGMDEGAKWVKGNDWTAPHCSLSRPYNSLSGRSMSEFTSEGNVKRGVKGWAGPYLSLHSPAQEPTHIIFLSSPPFPLICGLVGSHVTSLLSYLPTVIHGGDIERDPTRMEKEKEWEKKDKNMR